MRLHYLLAVRMSHAYTSHKHQGGMHVHVHFPVLPSTSSGNVSAYLDLTMPAIALQLISRRTSVPCFTQDYATLRLFIDLLCSSTS